MNPHRPSREGIERFARDYWDAGATAFAGMALPYFHYTGSDGFDLKDVGEIAAYASAILGYWRGARSNDLNRLFRNFSAFFAGGFAILPSIVVDPNPEACRNASYTTSSLAGIATVCFDWRRRRNFHSLEERAAEE